MVHCVVVHTCENVRVGGGEGVWVCGILGGDRVMCEGGRR